MAEFIHKAHVYNPKKHIINPNDWYVSEKLDGRYFIWDGGVTRGMPVENVTWANTKKDKRTGLISTGLWSSLGKIVNAPDFILDQLMEHPYMLEGELYLGRGRFQECMSITKRLDIEVDRWREIKLKIFGAPLVRNFLAPRVVSKTDVVIPVSAMSHWQNMTDCGISTFLESYNWLETMIPYISDYNIELVNYNQLGNNTINNMLKIVCDQGGEGLMMRSRYDVWLPKRMDTILKIKPWHDDEAFVVGYVAGNTGKTGKMVGLIGALIVESLGKRFELSGMTDSERAFTPHEDMIPGERCVGLSPHFPLGKKITYRYRELTVDGVPKEARYHRPYMEEE